MCSNMETSLLPEDLKQVTVFTKKLLLLLFCLFAIYLSFNFIFNVVVDTLVNKSILSITRHYIDLILVSWPFSVLVLGGGLLFTQQKSIAYFIARRMTSAGIDGIKGAIQEGVQILENQIIQEVDDKSREPLTTELIKKVEATTETIELTKQINILWKQLDFERIHNNIFGSQIAMLGSMRKDLLGINYKVIASVYEGWKENDEVLKNYNLDNYLNFLITHNLISETLRNQEKAYQITDRGVEFLNYIEDTKPGNKDH